MLKSHGLKRVLEVAAGCGVLAKPMRQRGLEWRCTDSHPASTGLPGEEIPEKLDALTALARYRDQTDVVFWAWWPRDDAGDAALAREFDCPANLPAIFVGEQNGISGSAALWKQGSGCAVWNPRIAALQPLGQMKLHPDTCEPEDLLNGADGSILRTSTSFSVGMEVIRRRVPRS